jgi:hypothetical protein
MEVEFKAWTKGSELALSFCDHRFRKRSRLAHRNDAPLPRHVANYSQQHGVAKSRTFQGWIDREDIALPGQADLEQNRDEIGMPSSAASEEPLLLSRRSLMGAVQPAAGDSETAYARSIVPFSYASVIAPTLIITRTLIEQSKILVKRAVAFPSRYSRLPQQPPPAMGPGRPPQHSGGRRLSRSSTAGVC